MVLERTAERVGSGARMFQERIQADQKFSTWHFQEVHQARFEVTKNGSLA